MIIKNTAALYRYLFKKNSIQHVVELFLTLCALTIFSGCSSEIPNRYYDESTNNNPEGTIRIDQIRPGEHISGMKYISLKIDSLDVTVKRVIIHIDDKEFTRLTKEPFAFSLHASWVPAGSHTLKIYVVAANNGIYSALDIPQLFYTIPFITDPGTPSPISSEVKIVK